MPLRSAAQQSSARRRSPRTHEFALLPAERNGADDALFLEHRHEKQRARAAQIGKLNERPRAALITRGGGDVGGVHESLCGGEASQRNVRIRPGGDGSLLKLSGARREGRCLIPMQQCLQRLKPPFNEQRGHTHACEDNARRRILFLDHALSSVTIKIVDFRRLLFPLRRHLAWVWLARNAAGPKLLSRQASRDPTAAGG